MTIIDQFTSPPVNLGNKQSYTIRWSNENIIRIEPMVVEIPMYRDNPETQQQQL